MCGVQLGPGTPGLQLPVGSRPGTAGRAPLLTESRPAELPGAAGAPEGPLKSCQSRRPGWGRAKAWVTGRPPRPVSGVGLGSHDEESGLKFRTMSVAPAWRFTWVCSRQATGLVPGTAGLSTQERAPTDLPVGQGPGPPGGRGCSAVGLTPGGHSCGPEWSLTSTHQPPRGEPRQNPASKRKKQQTFS